MSYTSSSPFLDMGVRLQSPNQKPKAKRPIFHMGKPRVVQLDQKIHRSVQRRMRIAQSADIHKGLDRMTPSAILPWVERPKDEEDDPNPTLSFWFTIPLPGTNQVFRAHRHSHKNKLSWDVLRQGLSASDQGDWDVWED